MPYLHRCGSDDRFRTAHRQSEKFHPGCCCASGYIHYLPLCQYLVHACRSRFHRYHRRCGWAYIHLPHLQAGASFAGADCHRCLFLYGTGAGHSAAYHACIDYGGGTENQDETTAFRIQNGEDCVPCHHHYHCGTCSA